MDDVLENLGEVWTSFLNARYGVTVQRSDITEWDMRKAFPMLTEEQIYYPTNNEELWKRVKPLPGSVKYVKKLIDDGHTVVVVTASHQLAIRHKLDHVLFRYFPYLEIRDVIVAYKKQLIRGDLLIDDNPRNLEGGEYKGILMDAPYNAKYEAEKNGFIRVHNWTEIYTVVNEISGGM